MLHRLGKGWGQKGSTLKMGAPCASTACFNTCFCCACERPTEIAASAKTKQIPRIKAEALLRSFFVFTGLSSLLQVATRIFEGRAEANEQTIAANVKTEMIEAALY